MTICIAAICEEGKNIVVAADRMFTSPLSVEFETNERKIEILSKSCVALAAGGTAYATEILDPVRRKEMNESPAVSDVMSEVLTQFKNVRAKKAEEMIVMPMVGNDFIEQRNKGMTLPQYLQTQPGIYQQLAGMSSQYNLGVDFLIAGIDTTGAHIYQIGNPGTTFPLDKLGHAAVGSGGIHAVISLSLSAQTGHRNLLDTLYSVYSAKKSAEVAPGVGKFTDLAIISKDEIWDCPSDLLQELDKALDEVQRKTDPDLGSVKEKYEALRKPK